MYTLKPHTSGGMDLSVYTAEGLGVGEFGFLSMQNWSPQQFKLTIPLSFA